MMNLIPAIDLIGGQCVRLRQGQYDDISTYATDPLTMAQAFESYGLQYLHLVDLDGARAQQTVHYDILKNISRHTRLHIDFSGGIRTDRDIAMAFDCGASQVTIGSMAVTHASKVYQWLNRYGPERIILSADVYDDEVMTRGWQDPSGITVFDLIDQYYAHGMQEFMCTDIRKDGMLSGPATTLYRNIRSRYPISLIASGGVSALSDLEQLQAAGCSGAIIGKAIYEGAISLESLRELNVSMNSK